MGKKFDLAGLIAGQNASAAVYDSDTIQRLPVEDIHDNSGNFYSVEDVKDLTDSISVSGVLQPILVRPRSEGGWLLIAGHRRTKAVRILREEWKGKGENPWNTIPAVVRPLPSNRAEELLEALALIQTNAAVRKLSDAEISAQAEKLTDILADLKREGYDFPGRMRKLVANALGVSETKLAKQKLIREKLSPGWLERWKAGTVAEYTAEVLAKYSPELQDALLFKKKLDPYTARSLAEYYAKCVAKRTCKVSHNVNCDWGDHFWAVGSRIENEWNRCIGYGESCCKDCKKALKCGQCCPKALEAAKKAEKRRKDEAAREQAKREREAAARKETADLLWARFKELREAAGLSAEQVEDGIKGSGYYRIDLAAFEDRCVSGYSADSTPERELGFKGCFAAARLFGVPVEALTDVEWKPSPSGTGERIATAAAGPRNDGDGEEFNPAEPQLTSTAEDIRADTAPEAEGAAGTAWHWSKDDLPINRPLLTYSKTNLGDWYRAAIWTGSVFVDPSNPKKELTGLFFTRWAEIPEEGKAFPPAAKEAGEAAEPYWRPFPKVKPKAGQRAMVVQKPSLGDHTSLLFEAKLAEWNGEAWHWVSELIPDVEAERVELWLPEPADPVETEDDDAEEDNP